MRWLHLMLFWPVVVSAQTKRPATVADAVETPRIMAGELLASPSGKKVAVVWVSPSISRNDNRWCVSVLDSLAGGVPSCRYALRSPDFLWSEVGLGGSYSHVPLHLVRWVDGDRYLLIRCQPVPEDPRTDVVLLDVQSGTLDTLYGFRGEVRELVASADGNTLAMYRLHPRDSERYDTLSTNGLSVDKLLFVNSWKSGEWISPVRDIVVHRNARSRRGAPDVVVERYGDDLVRTTPYQPMLRLAADGRWLDYTQAAPMLHDASVVNARINDSARAAPSRSYEIGVNGQRMRYDVGAQTKRGVVAATGESRRAAPFRLVENSMTPAEVYYKDVRLTDFASATRLLTLGPVEKVFWKNAYGAQCFGYLILPTNYERGKRYAAVVLLKDWTDQFIMESAQPISSSFSAQPLANNGFVVFLAAAPSAPTTVPRGTPGEFWRMENVVSMVESGVHMLDERGLIDTARLGIGGFSVTSWEVQYILAHSKLRFAAASTADGWNLNYVSYATQNLHGSPQGYDMGWTFDHLYGGPPYGETLANWVAYAPAFNTSRIRTPVLTQSHGDMTVAMEWFTSLHKLGKPVELYFFPEGKHNLQRPRQRVASQQLNVHWFRFWLQDSVGLSPAYDAGRFARWGALKAQHEANERALAAGRDPTRDYQDRLRREGWLP